MTRRLFALGVLLTVSALMYGQDKNSVKLTGYLIDNACAGAHVKDANFKETVKKHGTSCALMPNCAKTGYALFTADGKLYKFDEAGNKTVEELLKDTDTKNGVSVSVEATLDGETLHAAKVTEVKTTE
ncbi:MAG TPA: hypothetical protein VIV66_11445 [Pyrinomonadaceae bacterium]